MAVRIDDAGARGMAYLALNHAVVKVDMAMEQDLGMQHVQQPVKALEALMWPVVQVAMAAHGGMGDQDVDPARQGCQHCQPHRLDAHLAFGEPHDSIPVVERPIQPGNPKAPYPHDAPIKVVPTHLDEGVRIRAMVAEHVQTSARQDKRRAKGDSPLARRAHATKSILAMSR